MSGIETVGVVLGAIPLITSTIEVYRESSALFLGSQSAEDELSEIKAELETQHAILQQTLEVLLPGENIAQHLAERPIGGGEPQEIEARLKTRLANAYPLFCTIISEINNAVLSLDRSFLKTTALQKSKGKAGFDRNLIRWALRDKRKTQYAIENFRRRNQSLQILLIQVVTQDSTTVRQAVDNVSTILDRILEVERVAHNLEDLTTGRVAEPSGEGDDIRSTYSVQSEVGAMPPHLSGDVRFAYIPKTQSDGPSLRFLPLSLQAAEGSERSLKEHALVDTGATACAVSVTVALKLGLQIEDTTETVFTSLNQELPVRGTTRMSMRWKDDDGNRFGTKIHVYVVYGLSKSVLLSHDFATNHPEVWRIAKVVTNITDQINTTWFGKLSKREQEAQDSFIRQRLQQNKTRAEADKQQRLADLDQRLAGITLDLAIGSSAASTNTSTTGTNSSQTPT